MNKRELSLLTLLAIFSLFAVSLLACSGKAPAEQTPEVSIGEVQLNPHPQSLEDKTLLLRWNGKPNGDKLLTRVGELLAERISGVKVINMWEMDASTEVISDNGDVSAEIAEKIAAQNPDLVIAAQCD